MKKFEYKEPEFKVVKANSEDIVTTSPIDPTPGPVTLETIGSDWANAPIVS